MANPQLTSDEPPKGVSHFDLVDVPQYTSDGSTTSITTAWTAGTADGQVDNGDFLLVEAWANASGVVATPSGYTKFSEVTVGSWYCNVFYKTAGASEANITLSTSGANQMWTRAFAAKNISSIDSAQGYQPSNPWFFTQWLPEYQPSIDGTGASSDWVLLHSMWHNQNSATGWKSITDNVRDNANLVPDYAHENIAWYEIHDEQIASQGWRASAWEYPGEQFDGADVRLQAAYSAGSASNGYYVVYGFTLTTGVMGSADIANLPVIPAYTPLTDSAGAAQVANLPLIPTLTPTTDPTSQADVANLPIEPVVTPDDEWYLANLAIIYVITPSENAISSITMLMENPDLVAQDDTEIVEYREPDIGSAVRAIKVSGVSGNLVREWTLVVNLEQILNVDNEPVQADTVYDALQASAARNLIVPFSDLVGSVFRDEEEDVDVKIEEVTLLAKNIAQLKVVEVL